MYIINKDKLGDKMKKLIDNLEAGFTLSDGTKDYKAMLEEYLFEGYELSVEEFVCNMSGDLNEYFDRYASRYLTDQLDDLILNFPSEEEVVVDCQEEVRMRIAKMTWEQIKEDAEEE